ncbi:hypothetical protein NDS46_30615 (plasmid) [Paenibacillus thiaminolyticus]|uniref:hypothetical protein n=1 Tax=Paenibacillus thiaminolyticus TaxID=49283 RepID=UPI00232E8A0F|nr:hypothetical protein [Paenibacillus thiaminolyticus]WCF11703.1 hypothetical protein NDS46_30615 [Paenibacillus thiaminolyticus]
MHKLKKFYIEGVLSIGTYLFGKQHEDRFIKALKRANKTNVNKAVQTVLYLLTAIPVVSRD